MKVKTAMAAVYTEVTLEEIEKFLKRSFRASRPRRGVRNGEIIFELALGDAVGIRVQTSIRAGGSVSRSVGKDTIMAGLISLKDKGPLSGDDFLVVKRTQNWRDGLKDRIETLMEKYHDKLEFWEDWASTRQRRDDPAKAMRQQEEEARRDPDEDDNDGEPRRPLTPPPAQVQPPPKRFDPSRMVGDITDKQFNWLSNLLRGMTPAKWDAIDGTRKTELPTYPKNKGELRGITKGQASALIDLLYTPKLRYAAWEGVVEDLDLGGYDFRGLD